MDLFAYMLGKEAGGGSAPTGAIDIFSNGTYDVSSYASAVVDVPSAILSGIIISSNGTYQASTSGYDGFDNVVVDVPPITDDRYEIVVGTSTGSIYDSKISTMRNSMFMGNTTMTGFEAPNITSVTYSAFCGCTNLLTVSLPNCEHIDTGAFSGCTKLSSICFGNIDKLNGNVFRDTALQSVEFPSCSMIAGSYAFTNCKNLQTVSFPMLQKFNSGSTFQSCNKLESVYLLYSDIVSITFINYQFSETPILNSSYLGHYGSIYVPASLVDAYKSATNWSSISDRITAYTE